MSAVEIGIVPWEKVFANEGEWRAIEAARAWLKERGYSIGEMQGSAPMGVMLGDFDIAKWRNLTPTEIGALDGKIEGDKRNGPVTVRLKSVPAGEVAP